MVWSYGLIFRYRLMKDYDGIILASAHAIERVAIEGMRTWLAEREVCGVGPLLPRSYWCPPQINEGADVQKFLKDKLAKHGEKSVILVRLTASPTFAKSDINLVKVSFGTVFWPSIPEYVEKVILALIEKNFPFVCRIHLMPHYKSLMTFTKYFPDTAPPLTVCQFFT